MEIYKLDTKLNKEKKKLSSFFKDGDKKYNI